MRHFSNRNRPVHLGAFPLETLPRATAFGENHHRPDGPVEKTNADSPLGAVIEKYFNIYREFVDGEAATDRAPLEELPQNPTEDVKAACYFLDASLVGICPAYDSLWLQDQNGDSLSTPSSGRSLIVILVEHGRDPEAENLASSWVEGDEGRGAALRAAEIAIVIAGYIRNLGWHARAHMVTHTDIDLEAAAVAAGMAEWQDGGVIAPFVQGRFSLAVVATEYDLEHDLPLADGAVRGARGLRWWFGVGGTKPGHERAAEARRPTHLGKYPMENVKRVSETTTLILDEEIPRVPKRASFFERALKGDLGPKAQRERARFATKHPLAAAMTPLIGTLVPHQDGKPASETVNGEAESQQLSDAVRSLAYYLGADLVGVTRAKPFVWYSHDDDGQPIPVRHKWAVVLLIDQGHETMEGSSGDDWISGAQSMRAYLRGAEIAGVMAELFRRLGFSSRAQTNRDSDVLHIPLILEAGLGELSRIGELVLNPFVGPRFKSVVVTTDMPLAADQPIDFGLQDMCSKCMKCARECPCDAIPYGRKVMFNGYEMWKPDVHRCASYRVTNAKGSACGRCMKTCPYNHEGLLWFRPFLWMAINWPRSRTLIARFDDWIGNGRLNPVKKWWFDLEIVEGRSRAAKAANARELDLKKKLDPDKQSIAYFPASDMPLPDAEEPMPVDRKAGVAMAGELETPEEARARHRAGQPRPVHNCPSYDRTR